MSPGEIKTDRGSVYIFKDGFIAQDTTRTPNDFYAWEIAPEEIKEVGIFDKGLRISMKSQPAEAAGATFHNMVAPSPKPGHVSLNEQDASGNSGIRHVEMDLDPVEALISSRDWDRSILPLFGK